MALMDSHQLGELWHANVGKLDRALLAEMDRGARARLAIPPPRWPVSIERGEAQITLEVAEYKVERYYDQRALFGRVEGTEPWAFLGQWSVK